MMAVVELRVSTNFNYNRCFAKINLLFHLICATITQIQCEFVQKKISHQIQPSLIESQFSLVRKSTKYNDRREKDVVIW